MIPTSSNTLNDILNVIASADHLDLTEITKAIQVRYSQLFPDWEMVYLALPRENPEVREAVLIQAVKILERT